MFARTFSSLILIVCSSCQQSESLRAPHRPAEEDPDVGGFISETVASVEAGQASAIELESTTLRIKEGSTLEDAEVRLRKLEKVPERDTLVDLGEPKGEIVEVTFYAKETGKIFASDLFQSPYELSQELESIEDVNDLKFVVITSPNTQDETIQVVSLTSETKSELGLTSSSFEASIELVVTHAVIYVVEVKEVPASIIVIESSQEIVSTGGGNVGTAEETESPVVPNKPSNLEAYSASATKIDLSWTDNANNETAFKVERSLDGIQFELLATIPSNSIAYSDSAVLPATEYSYRVAACNSAGCSENSPTANASTTDVVLSNSWSEVASTNAPVNQFGLKSVWTGSKIVVWGGNMPGQDPVNTGGVYDPIADTWTATSTQNAPEGRVHHTAVWTGVEMLIWGGEDLATAFDSGGRYNPATDTWTEMSTTAAPVARASHTAVWTGSKVIIWGGFDRTNRLNSGGVYDVASNTWSATTTSNAPAPRMYHTAIWTGSKMIVWGGEWELSGGIYDPVTDTWESMATEDAPDSRIRHTAVWTGSKMIVWGGGITNEGPYFGTGAVYDPTTDSWSATSMVSSPTPRTAHSAIAAGSKMIVWGGEGGGFLNSGSIYDPANDSWSPIETIGAPPGRFDHTAIWTGFSMFVWGGYGDGGVINNGGILE